MTTFGQVDQRFDWVVGWNPYADDIGVRNNLYVVHATIGVSCYSFYQCTDMGTPELLAEMVQEVNGSQVDAEEQLSDHVYRFDAKAKTISLADTTMEQLEAKVSENVENYEATQSPSEAVRPHRHR